MARQILRGLTMLMLIIGLAFMSAVVTADGDTFDPNVSNPFGSSRVLAVVLQPDGKILIGGEFTMVGGVTRNHIARLNPDGTLDTTFDPDADGTVETIALQPDGKILAGGIFFHIGRETRHFIARLDATGAADSFDPNPDSSVFTIAVQSDGKILAGGHFSNIGRHQRGCIARLDATTGEADDSFDPGNGANVRTIVVQPDGKILVGGEFPSVLNFGGQPRNYIARLDPSGLADSFNPDADDTVYSIALQADGKVLAGGHFTNIGGQARTSIARLDAISGAADTFNPNPGINHNVVALAVQPDGKILAGGDFGIIGGQLRPFFVRLDPSTGLADSCDAMVSSPVYSIVVQPDGKLIIGGSFDHVGGLTRNRIARLELDCGLDHDCAFSIAPTSQNFPASGGNDSLSVITSLGCSWSAISNDSWITITSGASGSGNGTIDYSVTVNLGPARLGTMTVAGQTFTVTQDAAVTSVVIDGCDSGVPNHVFDDGTSFSDKIADCAARATNHGEFVSCVSHLINVWRRMGLINDAQRDAIMSCAAAAHIP